MCVYTIHDYVDAVDRSNIQAAYSHTHKAPITLIHNFYSILRNIVSD